MPEKRESFTPGSSSDTGYWRWINERHQIWRLKEAGCTKPWTNDPILQRFKFTNVFRELDTGTLYLRLMEKGQTDPGLILFNTIWYRIFNWWEHAVDLGFVENFSELHQYMLARYVNHERIFTGAHMVRGTCGGEPKHFGYLRLLRNVWDHRNKMAANICEEGSIRGAFEELLTIHCVGDFTAYEIASDLRWSLIPECPDKMTWGNPGNGARRGLKRLGRVPTVLSMVSLLQNAKFTTDFPFEIREVEHCLCEFDKYERCRLGQGTPRSKYNGC